MTPLLSSVSDSVPIPLDVLFFCGPSVAFGSPEGLPRGASLVRLHVSTRSGNKMAVGWYGQLASNIKDGEDGSRLFCILITIYECRHLPKCIGLDAEAVVLYANRKELNTYAIS